MPDYTRPSPHLLFWVTACRENQTSLLCLAHTAVPAQRPYDQAAALSRSCRRGPFEALPLSFHGSPPPTAGRGTSVAQARLLWPAQRSHRRAAAILPFSRCGLIFRPPILRRSAAAVRRHMLPEALPFIKLGGSSTRLRLGRQLKRIASGRTGALLLCVHHLLRLALSRVKVQIHFGGLNWVLYDEELRVRLADDTEGDGAYQASTHNRYCKWSPFVYQRFHG
ncbi:hypothetical protein NDU88_006811 [Pleurodeles waltl]|uniref:Uncharacterized protein n=1 Tax=Pleurodeles waltl TaxID=8319 RepID=A0AAV7TYU3_PLEWA|nr:hypothetical protein NDU88_006811 [Pleurodeles waltl]